MNYPQLGAAIAQVLRAHGVKNSELAEVHSGRLGLKLGTFKAYLVNLKKGYLYGNAQRGIHRQEYAARLAHVLYSAGIQDGHQIIQQVRQIDPEFSYPPRSGISYEALKSEFFKSSKTLHQLLVEHPERVPSIMELLLLDEKSYNAAETIIHRLIHLQKQSKSLEKKVEQLPEISVVQTHPENAA